MEKLNEKCSRRYISGEYATFVCFELKRGALVPTHHHPSEQMSYVTRGKVKVTAEGKEFIVSKGELIHLPFESPHQFEAMEDSTVLDVFSPPRKDWLEGKDNYLRK